MASDIDSVCAIVTPLATLRQPLLGILSPSKNRAIAAMQQAAAGTAGTCGDRNAGRMGLYALSLQPFLAGSGDLPVSRNLACVR